jgi:hypothetical protein
VQPGSHCIGKLPANLTSKYRLVLFSRGHAQVGGWQDGEKDRLYESYEQMKGDK